MKRGGIGIDFGDAFNFDSIGIAFAGVDPAGIGVAGIARCGAGGGLPCLAIFWVTKLKSKSRTAFLFRPIT